jgi:ribosome-associated protein
VTARVRVLREDVEFTAVRSQGAGGQNVNKVSSAAHLRFEVGASSLPDTVKTRLLALADRRVGADGCVVIKSQTHRSLARNQAEALARLQALIDTALAPPVQRVATRPTRASKQRRLHNKALRGEIKAQRKAQLD